MAKAKTARAAPPIAGGDPSRALVRDWFRHGFFQLFDDVQWRWLNANLARAEKAGLNQRAVAAASEMDEAALSKFIAGGTTGGGRWLTREAVKKLTKGFFELGQRHGFETASIDPAMTDKQCETAGWIHALNRTGEAIDVPCRPVGTIHFCCLRTIYGSRAWVEAMAGGLQPPEWNKLTRDTLKKAEENAARYHPLAAYDAAAIRYPLESTTRSVIEFVRTWTPAWRIVFKALEVGAR